MGRRVSRKRESARMDGLVMIIYHLYGRTDNAHVRLRFYPTLTRGSDRGARRRVALSVKAGGGDAIHSDGEWASQRHILLFYLFPIPP